MVNDDHDDRVNTAISVVCGATPKAKKDKVTTVLKCLNQFMSFFKILMI